MNIHRSVSLAFGMLLTACTAAPSLRFSPPVARSENRHMQPAPGAEALEGTDDDTAGDLDALQSKPGSKQARRTPGGVCRPVFSHCSCSFVCMSVAGPMADCARACPMQPSAPPAGFHCRVVRGRCMQTSAPGQGQP